MREVGLPWWLSGKVCTCQCRRPGFHPWVRKIPWSWKWQPTPGCLPGESKDTGAWQAIVHGITKSRTWQHVHTQWGLGGSGWKGIHLLHLVQNQKSLFYVLFNPISPSENTSGYRILLRSCGPLWVLFRSTLLDKSYACDSSEISLSLLGLLLNWLTVNTLDLSRIPLAWFRGSVRHTHHFFWGLLSDWRLLCCIAWNLPEMHTKDLIVTFSLSFGHVFWCCCGFELRWETILQLYYHLPGRGAENFRPQSPGSFMFNCSSF